MLTWERFHFYIIAESMHVYEHNIISFGNTFGNLLGEMPL